MDFGQDVALLSLFAAVQQMVHQHPGPFAGVAVTLLLLVGALVALPFDRRRVSGLNPWIKPIKFDLSTSIFLVTCALLLWSLRGHVHERAAIGWAMGISMIVENTLISLQALRGIRSHMNFTTSLNTLVFGLMGIFIVVNTLALAWLLGLYCAAQPQLSPAFAWGVRFGLLAAVAGSLEGILIVSRGGFTVGAPDGGEGLPFLNWSTRHGDLRVAHFLALHALQVLPAAGWLLGRLNLAAPGQIGAIALISFAYFAVTWLLFRRALAGRPLLRTRG